MALDTPGIPWVQEHEKNNGISTFSLAMEPCAGLNWPYRKLDGTSAEFNYGINKASLGMNGNIHKIEESIRRMTAVVRLDQAVQTARSFGEDTNPDIKPMGWWILACGEQLNEESSTDREKSREVLLEDVKNAGLVLPENIWVWDEAGTTQLVISTVPTLKRAKLLSKRLREKGLMIRIRREKI